jgi:tRNA-specific 2-thiouridylase
MARIRHRGALIPVERWSEADGQVGVALRVPARAATRGQAVVLYSGEDVLGGGWIRDVRDAQGA